MRYQGLRYISIENAKGIIKNDNYDELLLLPLSLGEYCDDCIFAQKICLFLINKKEEALKANAVLGLSYIARNHKGLDEKFVKPAILKVMRQSNNSDDLCRIRDAVDDIYLFMEWKRGLSFYLSRFICSCKLKKNRS